MENFTHNKFEGLKINFGPRTLTTENGITTIRTRGLVEKHTNTRKVMIEKIDEQIRKALKQGRRLTIVIWDEDNSVINTLTLLLAEIGRLSWHGKVYVVNMYEQKDQYGRIYGCESDDLEKVAALNKVFLVNHYAASERCEALYKLTFKLMPAERPISTNRRLLGSHLGLMLKAKPKPWEKCMAETISKAMSQQIAKTGPIPTTTSASRRQGEEKINVMTNAIKVITTRPCILSSKKVMLYLREHTPVTVMKQIDTIIWAMIGANRNDVMTDREIRNTIRKAKDYVKTEEFRNYHMKRLDHLIAQLEQDKKLDYSSPPYHARTRKETPRGLRRRNRLRNQENKESQRNKIKSTKNQEKSQE